MKVKVENSGPCRKTMAVELPPETVSGEYEKVIRRFASGAAIPGYRKGKAPQTLVERRYKKQIDEEVKDSLIASSCHAALKEEQIKPVAVLELSDVSLEPGRPMRYKVVVDVPPQFKLPKYRKIAVKPEKTEVTEEQVQKQLEMLLDSCAEYNAAGDREARKGDFVQFDYEGFHEGKPVAETDGTMAGPAKGKDFWMALEGNAFLPGFDKGLEGMKQGEDKEIRVELPRDFRHQALAGKTVDYRVKLKAIREKKLPEINEEFLRRAGADSEEALRAKLRELLEAQADRTEKERLKRQITNDLLKSVAIDLPQSAVQDETRVMFASLVNENMRRGASRKQIQEQRQQLLDAAAKAAESRVKLGYILSRIAEAEKIEVGRAELDSAVQALASSRGVEPETLRKELEERGEINAVRNEILADKTLDFLLENASSVEEGLLGRLMKGRSQQS